MEKLILCDTHCDTASRCLDEGLNLFSNPLSVSIEKTKKYQHYTQFFASFIDPEYYNCAYERCTDIIHYIHSQIDKYSSHIKLCTNSDDLENAKKSNKVAAFISVEGGEAIKNFDSLYQLYDMGVRMITLTWNNDNAIGGGAFGDGRGLSLYGKNIIKKMNSLGIITDVSHASEKTFYDICSVTTKPVIASHSNSYELRPHSRNLKKEQFKELKKLDGVVGINFSPEFLTDKKTASISDIVNHIEYFLSLDGEDNICIGSDFDGIYALPDGICDVSDTYTIFDALAKKGISNNVLEKIAYKNLYRLIGICL